MYFDDYEPDDYFEPSELDVAWSESTDRIRDALKQSVISEINTIKLDNEYLKKTNERLNERVREVKQLERKLEHEKRNVLQTVRRERLSELMKDFQIIRYRATTSSRYMPKCDKCNDDRNITYTTPSGKPCTESCSCCDSTRVYVPQEMVCTEFKVDSSYSNKMRVWYKVHHERDYDYYGYESSNYMDYVWQEGDAYEDIKNEYKTFFDTKEDCQKYCDWKNRDVDFEKYSEEELVKHSSKPKLKV